MSMDFEKMTRNALSGMSQNGIKVLDHEKAVDAIIDFQPIKDLKPGERLRKKSCYPNTLRGHDDNPVLTVHAVGKWEPLPVLGNSNRRRLFDFTFIEVDTDGELIEWFNESRLYERVE